MYLNWVREFKKESGVEVWAHCLMPNHVHLAVVPEQEDSLSRFFRQVHLTTLDTSTFVKTGRDTFGRNDSIRSSWMSNIFWRQSGMWN